VRELGFYGIDNEEEGMLQENDVNELMESNPKLASLFEFIQENEELFKVEEEHASDVVIAQKNMEDVDLVNKLLFATEDQFMKP
jgi:DNA polymerase III alpha subunit